MQRLDTTDSSTSEGEFVGASICRLRLVSSLRLDRIDQGTFYEKIGCYSVINADFA
ncbi:hypothetical protein Hanom_Chr17g01590391 [Helianthus anomalus]